MTHHYNVFSLKGPTSGVVINDFVLHVVGQHIVDFFYFPLPRQGLVDQGAREGECKAIKFVVHGRVIVYHFDKVALL